MELASKYNPADVEGKWYQYWLDHHLFSSKPDGREPLHHRHSAPERHRCCCTWDTCLIIPFRIF